MMAAEQGGGHCSGGSVRCFADIGEGSCGGAASKRLKAATATANSQAGGKEKKDKVGEKVAALQQLVSPFGKTDTASVLLEAAEYIRFLHDQLQVLSSPYLRNPSAEDCATKCGGLRNRGLCLVPVATMVKFSRSNGADLWAPMNTSK